MPSDFPETITGNMTTSSKNAGTYTYSTTFSGVIISGLTVSGGKANSITNYNLTYSATLEITAKPITVKVPVGDEESTIPTQEYNNTAFTYQYNNNNIEGIVAGENITGSLTTAKYDEDSSKLVQASDVGTYTYNLDVQNSGIIASTPTPQGSTSLSNYQINYDVKLKITVRGFSESNITITYKDNYVYDGQTHRPDMDTSSFVVTDKVFGVLTSDSFVVTGEQKKDANTGGSSYTFTIKGQGNYTDTEISKPWTISPKAITVNATCSADMKKVYNRQKLVYNVDNSLVGHSNDITGLVSGEVATATFTTQG